jgi:LPS export ABC transporter protein LptC
MVKSPERKSRTVLRSSKDNVGMKLLSLQLAHIKWLMSQFLSKLPLLLMLALTLMSFVLLQQRSRTSEGQAVPKTAFDQDLYMDAFTVHRYATTGAIKTIVQSDHAVHSAKTETLTASPFLMLHATGSKSYMATAKTAVLGDDATQANIQGNAQIHSFDASRTGHSGARMQSESFNINLTLEQISSQHPTKIESDGNTSQAGAMLYDNVAGKMSLTGRVKATLTPKR